MPRIRILIIKKQSYDTKNMMTTPTRTFPVPSTTKHTLPAIVEWLEDGSIVCLGTPSGRYRLFSSPTNDMNLDENRICIVMCRTMPSLLDDGEWEWNIKNESHIKHIEHTNIQNYVERIIQMNNDIQPNVFLVYD